jgi:WD40 repeat protein
MAQETSASDGCDHALDALIATIYEAIDAGRHLDPDEWIGRFPEFSGELKEFFADLGMGDRLNEQFGPTGATGSSATVSIARHRERIEAASRLVEPGQVPDRGGVAGSFNRYSLLRKIGEGGQGEVWKALQSNPTCLVALKILRGGFLASADDVRRFREEAELIASLDHPHIVPVYEVGECQGRHFFSMKLMAGGRLTDRLSAYHDQPEAIAALMIELAEAVQHAHQHGVIHRDLKPSNIVFDSSDRAYLTDFGLAKRTGEDADCTVTGSIVGTAAYMSPEQASGQKGAVSTLSDVYGLGAVLYSLLTTRAPFLGNTVTDILVQVRERVPDPPSRIRTRVPRDLETICLKCLNKEPKERYKSAQEMVDDLNRWREGRPIKARPVGQLERLGKWCRRRPSLAASLASLVLVAVLGFTGVLWKWREAVEERRQRERSLYYAYVAKAATEWSEQNYGHASEWLETSKTQLSQYLGWEWYYLDRLRQEPTVPPVRQGAAAYCAAFSPDGRWIAVGDASGCVSFWDALDAASPARALPGKALSTIRGVAFSPGGRRLLAVSRDGQLLAWDFHGELTSPPTEPRAFQAHKGSALRVLFSPDGTRVVFVGLETQGEPGGPQASVGMVEVYDVTTFAPPKCLKGHRMLVLGAAYSRDGKRLATSSDDGMVKVWDTASWNEILTLPASADPVRGVAFYPDNRRLAVAGGDGSLHVWDTAAGVEVLHPSGGHSDSIRDIAVSPDGLRVVTCSGDKTVKLWDAETGQEALTLRGHSDNVRGIAFSPDGHRLASVGEDGRLVVHDATPSTAAWEAVATYRGHTGVIYGLASGVARDDVDAPFFASASGDHSIRVWSARDGRDVLEIGGFPNPVYGVAFSPDGRLLASAGADHTLRILDARTGRCLRESEAQEDYDDDDPLCVAFNPAGDRLVSVGSGGKLRVWDPGTGKLLDKRTGHERSKIWCAAFDPASPGGRTIATGSDDHRVLVWDCDHLDREPVALVGHEDAVYWLAFSPRGSRIVSLGRDQTVRLWDGKTGRQIALSPTRYSERFDAVAFSPDGRYVAAGNGDGSVKVLDATDLQEVLTLHGHWSRILAVAFSPDGKRLASGGFDRTVKVWDTTHWPDPPSASGAPAPP